MCWISGNKIVFFSFQSEVVPSLVFCVTFCRLMFVLLSLIFWPSCSLSFVLRLLITPWVSSNFWSLYCLSFDYSFWLPLWYLQTVGHCIVCPSITASDYSLWYLLTCGHCIVCPSITASDYPFSIF